MKLRVSQSVLFNKQPGRRGPTGREVMGFAGEADTIGHRKYRANDARSTPVRQRLVIAAYVFPEFTVDWR